MEWTSENKLNKGYAAQSAKYQTKETKSARKILYGKHCDRMTTVYVKKEGLVSIYRDVNLCNVYLF